MNPSIALEFLVQGSDPNPYKVTFIKDQDDIKATCTCKAGIIGILCKHRLSLLDGDKSALVSDNSDQLLDVASWLSGSNLAAAISEVVCLESEKKKIEAKIKRAKKIISDLLLPKRPNF
jgi:hypothetical protein